MTTENKLPDDLPGMLGVMEGTRAQRWPHTMDAQEWAQQFYGHGWRVWKEPGGVESDQIGLMTGWFSNAIMAGFDAANMRNAASIAALEAERDAAIRQVEAAERDARCYRSALVDVRMSLHAAGRRPETCYEMSTIDNALAQQSSGEKP